MGVPSVGNLQVAHVDLDPYLTIGALATYSGLSRRTLQRHIADPADPIPHFKPGGKILVRRSEFDRWMDCHRTSGTPDVNDLVNAVVRKVRG